MAIIKLKIDDDIKNQATDIFNKLGLDLSTAIRLFLIRSIYEKGIPFRVFIDKESYDASKAIAIMEKIQDSSMKSGISSMTLDEINQEITQVRKERSSNK